MSKYNKEDTIHLVGGKDVEFIRLQFADIFGMLKSVAVTFNQLEKALDSRYMFDSSAIEGFVRAEETDMYLYPDLDTLEIFPWHPQRGRVARLVYDVYYSDNTPFGGDPKYVLKEVLKRMEDMEYRFNVEPECEFFLFHTDEEGRPTTITCEMTGYFGAGPINLAEDVRRDIVLNLEGMEFEIESPRYEIAPAQHEVDFKYTKSLMTADNILTFRMAVKTIVKRHDLHATFMPKPNAGVSGSGIHIDMSLKDKNGENVFADTSDELGLSETAYQFMAGILAHIRNMIIPTNPVVNSYKRLIPGYDAPTYIGWSPTVKRGQLIRIPSSRGESTRIELRSPDSAVSSYLALAARLAAGLDGIKKNMVPPRALSVNVSSMDEREWEELGVSQLSETLGEAVEAFGGGEFLMGVLGNYIYTKYLEAKKEEWGEFRAQVVDWGIGEYLYKL